MAVYIATALISVLCTHLTGCKLPELHWNSNIGRGKLVVQPTVIFPAAPEGTVVMERVRIRNTGLTTLVIYDVEVIGPPRIFGHQGLTGLRVGPRESAYASLTAVVDGWEPATAELRIRYESRDRQHPSSMSIALKRTEVVAELALSADPIDFGRVPIGANQPRIVTIQNVGNISVELTDVASVDPQENVIATEPYLSELPMQLMPDEEWSFEVDYLALNDDRYETQLQIEYQAAGDGRRLEQQVRMIANDGVPCIAVNHEDGFDFGPVAPGLTGEDEFTITNCSTGENAQPLTVSQLTLLDTDRRPSAESFAMVNTPTTPFDIAPGDASTFSISYAPSSPDGAETAWLEIVSSDRLKSPLEIEITGFGTAE